MVELAIEAVDATKRFGSFTAVSHVSLTVEPGEIVGLLGANGAGKTTLIRMIIGLTGCDEGAIRLLGAPPGRSGRARLGYMPQGLGLYQELSVQENVDFVAAAFKITHPPELPASLDALRRRPVAEIGLGLQRQLAFYCALAHAPEVLILDEPTSGVDPLVRARLWDTIHDQAALGRGVLVTTHYLQEAEQCDRLELMARGSVVASGRLKDVIGDARATIVTAADWQGAFDACQSAGLPVTLAGRSVRIAGDLAAPALAALSSRGIVADVRLEAASLEEVMVLIAATSRSEAATRADGSSNGAAVRP